MSTQPILLYDPLLFFLLYFNHCIIYKTLSCHFCTQCFFYFTDIMVYIYLCSLLCIYVKYNYYLSLGTLANNTFNILNSHFEIFLREATFVTV